MSLRAISFLAPVTLVFTSAACWGDTDRGTPGVRTKVPAAAMGAEWVATKKALGEDPGIPIPGPGAVGSAAHH